MKIKLVSDLHLEFSDINIRNDENCDVLILSGDIMIAVDLHDHPEENVKTAAMLEMLGSRQEKVQRFRDFLKRCSFQFPHVFYVAGNHEFYHGKWTQSLITLSNECAKFPNVYFLEAGCKKIDDVTFVGGTLWTDMNKNFVVTDPIEQRVANLTRSIGNLPYSMYRYDQVRHTGFVEEGMFPVVIVAEEHWEEVSKLPNPNKVLLFCLSHWG